MNRLDKRVDRLWRATHTFVTARDNHLLAAYWEDCLGDTVVSDEEIKGVFVELQKITNADDWKATLSEFVENNRVAYYASMRKAALERIERHPKGSWISNKFDGFLDVLAAARSLEIK